MTLGVSIRTVSLEDTTTFKAIRLRALEDSPSAFASTLADTLALSDQEWQTRVQECCRPEAIGFLAFEGEEACGMIRGSPDERDLKIGWVESMWVAPRQRRRGVGSRLLQAVIAWAKNRNLHALILEVTSTNRPAIGLYEHCGFAATGRTVPYRNDENLIEIEMLLNLDAASV